LTEDFPQFIELTIVGGKPMERQRETSSKYKTHLYERYMKKLQNINIIRRSNSANISVTVLPPPESFAKQLRSTSLVCFDS
jgi:hypothetical protein